MSGKRWKPWFIALFIMSLVCGFVYVNPFAAETKHPVPKGNYITIATGSSSAPYYMVGNAFAKVIEKNLKYNVTVQSTDGTIENIRLLHAKKAEMSFAMSDIAFFAYQGDKKAEMENIKAIAGLYLNYVQIVTLKDSPLLSVKDLKGKKVGVGVHDSGIEANARMILQEYGITYQDITPVFLTHTDAAEQLKNHTIDAAFFTTGLPNPSVIDLIKLQDIKVIPIQLASLESDKQKYPFFIAAEIPPGTYNNETPVPTIAVRNIMLVRGDLPDEEVYSLTKVLFDNLELLKNAHKDAGAIDVNLAWRDLPVPLHPGAIKYYKTYAKLDPDSSR